MKLTYEDIEVIRDTLIFGDKVSPDEINTLCDMALRLLDLEYEHGEKDDV